MKLSDIEELWSKDSDINPMDLGGESLKIPKLHAKYHSILNNEKLVLMRHKIELDKLSLTLEAYFLKTLTVEELKTFGLPDYSEKRVLKPDIQKHIDVWPSVVEKKLLIGAQNEKIDYLKDVIKMIHNRSFQIRDAVEWVKFTNGG